MPGLRLPVGSADIHRPDSGSGFGRCRSAEPPVYAGTSDDTSKRAYAQPTAGTRAAARAVRARAAVAAVAARESVRRWVTSASEPARPAAARVTAPLAKRSRIWRP